MVVIKNRLYEGYGPSESIKENIKMYAAAKRKKKNDSISAACSVAQCVNRKKRAKGFEGGRPGTKRLRRLIETIQNKKDTSLLKSDSPIQPKAAKENLSDHSIINLDKQTITGEKGHGEEKNAAHISDRSSNLPLQRRIIVGGDEYQQGVDFTPTSWNLTPKQQTVYNVLLNSNAVYNFSTKAEMLDLIKDIAAKVAQGQNIHNIRQILELKIYYGGSTFKHNKTIWGLRDRINAKISSIYSNENYQINTITVDEPVDSDVEIYYIGVASLTNYGFKENQKLGFIQQLAWTPGMGKQVFLNAARVDIKKTTDDQLILTSAHEVGHTLGLEHPEAGSLEAKQENVMNQGETGKQGPKISDSQLDKIRELARRGTWKLNMQNP